MRMAVLECEAVRIIRSCAGCIQFRPIETRLELILFREAFRQAELDRAVVGTTIEIGDQLVGWTGRRQTIEDGDVLVVGGTRDSIETHIYPDDGSILTR